MEKLMNTRSCLVVTLIVTALLGAAGCATQSNSSNVYNAGQVQREQVVRLATVESVREITIQRQNNGAGTVAGGLVGGIAGGGMGGGRGSSITAVLGAVAGGMAGQAIENSQNQHKGLEIIVRLDGGETRAIVQEADEAFRPGERVRILSSGGTSRVTH